MFNPIQPNIQSTLIPMDAFPGQKLERVEENPRPVVDRKHEVPSAREEIPREEIERAAEKLGRLMGKTGKRVKIKVRKKAGGVMVIIVDEGNEETIEEISPQEVLNRLRSFNQLGGLLFDKRV